MTSTVESPIQNLHDTTSIQSTPGRELPGAFPREHTATSRQRRSSDRPQPISLPSTEKEGVHPGEHYGGVGPLPGSISETSVAKLPDERESERKAASGPSSRSKEVTVDTDRGDDACEAVAAAIAPGAQGVTKTDEQASESEAVSASREKEPAADMDRGDGPCEGVAAARSGAPSKRSQDSPVPQGPDIASERKPEEQRAEARGTADITAPADSKLKEDTRREKSGGESETGSHPPTPPPPGTTMAEDVTLPKNGEDPNRAAAAQQQQQRQPPPQRKGRSSSDSDASNHVKASVMNRVKGEMKVLLGKASGNREKVEEGERMKHGTQ